MCTELSIVTDDLFWIMRTRPGMELDVFYTKEDGTRVSLVFGCFEDKGITSYLNNKE